MQLGQAISSVLATINQETDCYDRWLSLEASTGTKPMLTALESGVIGNDFYVANTDALIKLHFKGGETRMTPKGVKVEDLPGGSRLYLIIKINQLSQKIVISAGIAEIRMPWMANAEHILVLCISAIPAGTAATINANQVTKQAWTIE